MWFWVVDDVIIGYVWCVDGILMGVICVFLFEGFVVGIGDFVMMFG